MIAFCVKNLWTELQYSKCLFGLIYLFPVNLHSYLHANSRVICVLVKYMYVRHVLTKKNILQQLFNTL